MYLYIYPMHTQICMALTRSNSQDQIDGFVTNLKKRWLFLLKMDGYF